MSSQLYIGNGQAAPAVIVEKPTPMPYSIQYNIDANGKLTKPTSIMNFTGVKDLGDYCLQTAYRNGNYIDTIDLSDLENITGTYALDSAFANCNNLTSVDLSGLETISGERSCWSAFSSCTNLTSVDFSSLKDIRGSWACYNMFQGCTSLESISLPNLVCFSKNAEYAMYNMFSSSGIQTASFNNLEFAQGRSIFSGSFQSCKKLTTVNFPKLISIYGGMSCGSMFEGCVNLTNVNFDLFTTFSNNESSMGGFSSAFNNCTSLETLSFPKLIRFSNYGGLGCFGCTNLKNIYLPELRDVGLPGFDFSNCTKLETITFPKLEKIQSNGLIKFIGCTSLTDIYFPALYSTSFEYSLNSFNNMLSGLTGCTIHLPTNFDPKDPDKVFDITTLTGYPNFGGTNTILAFDQTPELFDFDLSYIREIKYVYELSQLFAGSKKVKSVDLSNLETINNASNACQTMFQNCSNLQSINLSKLKSITGYWACYSMFQGCTSLAAIDLSSLETIGDQQVYDVCRNMFQGCTNLATVDLSSLKAIYSCQYMFQGCTNLTSVNLSSVTYVNGDACQYMFGNCVSLKELSFPSLKTVGSYVGFRNMLYGCTDVTVHFPSNMSGKFNTNNFGGTNTTVLFDLPATE